MKNWFLPAVLKTATLLLSACSGGRKRRKHFTPLVRVRLPVYHR